MATPDLDGALDWLERHINLEATAGKVEGISLARMQQLVSVLGEPQKAYPVVHVTGTNGKGSTARLIAALLAEAGLSVGTYASPHLQRLNERISRNGEPIEDHELAEVLNDISVLEALVDHPPSYFEIMTGAAFRWFADVAVDVAVVEVGMLGRYDATNVVDSQVAVITNIGRDHSDFTGDWRRRIAAEKAGIIKPSSWVIVGDTDPELHDVFRAEAGAGFWQRGDDFDCVANGVAVGGRLLDLRTPGGVLEDVFLSLHGAYQGDNAAAALVAAEAFFGRALEPDVVAAAFATARMPGRFEIVGHNPLVVLDGAHNPDGAAAAIDTLTEDFTFEGDLVLLVGMLDGPGRQPVELLQSLDVSQAQLVITCTAPSPRAIPARDLALAAESAGALATMAVDAVDRGLAAAIDEAGEGGAVLVTGSLYAVGAARTALGLT